MSTSDTSKNVFKQEIYFYCVLILIYFSFNKAYNFSTVNVQEPYSSAPTYPVNQYNGGAIQNETKNVFSSLGCSIFNLLCCFCWLGIPAIIFSVKAKESVRNGQLVEARSEAKIASILNIVGICIGSISLVIVIIYLIVLFSVLRY